MNSSITFWVTERWGGEVHVPLLFAGSGQRPLYVCLLSQECHAAVHTHYRPIPHHPSRHSPVSPSFCLFVVFKRNAAIYLVLIKYDMLLQL